MADGYRSRWSANDGLMNWLLRKTILHWLVSYFWTRYLICPGMTVLLGATFYNARGNQCLNSGGTRGNEGRLDGMQGD